MTGWRKPNAKAQSKPSACCSRHSLAASSIRIRFLMQQRQPDSIFNRFKRLGLAMICLVLAAGLVTSCKPKPPAGSAGTADFFQTQFQNESQFIVEAIVSDLAEQMFYAAYHCLPDQQHFSVSATEKPGSPPDAPVYKLQIGLDPKKSDLKLELNVNGPIWSPAVYQSVVTQLAQAVGLSVGSPDRTENTALLAKLSDGTPETIEKENQKLSAALENDFTNPELHEQAAVLLGAFLLRDHSGHFFEIRSPLSRLTAHLAMARFLRGAGASGVNGQMAEAMMLSLVNDQASALECLNAIDTNYTGVVPMIRALRTRTTGDYRTLDKMDGLSRVESVEWFSAWADFVSTPMAWLKLSDDQKQTIDFVRAVNEENYSVEMGHQLLAVSVPLEMREINSVYALSHQEKLPSNDVVKALNELPERCFTQSGGEAHVRVIGWGQWAEFLQRHLCHAIQQDFYFMNYMWGVPDDAKEFAAQYKQAYGGLRLYPFVRRYNCTDVKSYHQSVDDGFKVIVATPQFVPAECWNYLCKKVDFAPPYRPIPNPHVNNWHSHNPPPGTIYDLNPRLNQPSLNNRQDAVARFEQLHEMSPYDCRIVNFLIKLKFNDNPTYDQATNLFQAVLPYSLTAMRTVANSVYDQPEKYEKLMLQAAALDPVCFYELSQNAWEHHDEDKAARYDDQACAADPDSVRVANHATWRVEYYLKKGQIEKARQIADDAAEVYSYGGLEAKGIFMERTTNYDGAFEWFAKIEERYDNSRPLIIFCLCYKNLTGDTRFDSELKKRLPKMFPKGIETVSVVDFQGPPTDGVLIKKQNDLLLSAGLKMSDVIVALNSTRTHTLDQYTCIRDSLTKAELDLIVWQGSAYHEIKASPPNHLFGADFGDYQPQ
jgi:tetratricopeptide (TPR) repeat protein